MHLRHIGDDNQPSMNPYSTRHHCYTPVSRLVVAATLALTCALPAHASDKKAPPAKPAAEYPQRRPPQRARHHRHRPLRQPEGLRQHNLPCVCPLPRPRPRHHHQRRRHRHLLRRRPHAVHLRQRRQDPHDLPEEASAGASSTYKHPRALRSPSSPSPSTTTPSTSVTQDDNDFGFQGTTVNPHSTSPSCLFCDIRPSTWTTP